LWVVDRRAPHRPQTIRLGDQDLELLRFLAEHRLVLPEHAAALLGRSLDTARARLARLAGAGYVRSESLFRGQPTMYLITRAGLKVIGSAFEVPRLDMRCYAHDLGMAWLWLAARAGTFGPLGEIIAERRLRSHDASCEAEGDPLGVRLGGVGPRGQERLHYPDLLLRAANGRRVALELELSPKWRPRLETILAGYGADPRIDGVVYFIASHSVARSVQAAAGRLGMGSLVHLQRVRLTASNPAATRDRVRARTAPAHAGRPTEAAR
jgi:hypothetical protein